MTTQINNISNEEETIELITEGDFYDEGESFRLVYDETELSGLEGTRTTLKIQDEKVVMSRSGNASSVMEFERGKRHQSLYDTEYGSMYMEMYTTKVDVSMKKNPLTIDIHIDYDIIVKNMFEGKNQMHIRVKQ